MQFLRVLNSVDGIFRVVNETVMICNDMLWILSCSAGDIASIYERTGADQGLVTLCEYRSVGPLLHEKGKENFDRLLVKTFDEIIAVLGASLFVHYIVVLMVASAHPSIAFPFSSFTLKHALSCPF